MNPWAIGGLAVLAAGLTLHAMSQRAPPVPEGKKDTRNPLERARDAFFALNTGGLRGDAEGAERGAEFGSRMGGLFVPGGVGNAVGAGVGAVGGMITIGNAIAVKDAVNAWQNGR